MSGVLGALHAGASTYLVVVVVDIGGGIFGFRNGNGSINGVSIDPPLRSLAIQFCESINGGSIPFTFQGFGVVSRSFFQRLSIQKTDGTRLVLNTSDANFSNPSGAHTFWEWTGNGTIWNAAGTRMVEICF